MKLLIPLFAFVLILIASCAASYRIDMNEETNYPEGRYLYASKCNACHRTYNPNEFRKAEWDKVLNEMKPKAKITDEEKELIYSWISERINKQDTVNSSIQQIKN